MRKCKKKLGSRNYKNYSPETLIKALNEIRSKKLSLSQSSAKYGICKGTLSHNLRKKHINTKPGRPNVLDDDEEKALVHILMKTAEWGFQSPFDAESFLDWLKQLFLVETKHLTGIKVLIGDNLASHFSQEVMQLCEEHSIKLVCLPPHSTAQPLDVAFFAPIKKSWEKSSYNIAAKLGFRTTGIFPVNRDQVLKKLPKDVTENKNGSAMSDSLLEFLQKIGTSQILFFYDQALQQGPN
ncbi:hypothetical protein ILUMI_19941 [Ignelater luminosus]|uniref:Uncharacterized protein n=1 Tax=Ignelater luminosus TaxID=2038154 RepID=A0A8K0CJ59_IGNLU|nr:hypothetical protein ILUMI_19941 [Ignelater luminosus]